MVKKNNSNALTHGAYARDVVLSWESRDEFRSLLEDLRAEFRPEGASENEIVVELAILNWRKRRVWRVSQHDFYDSAYAIEAEAAGSDNVRKMRRHRRQERDTLGKALRGLNRVSTALAKKMKKTPASTEYHTMAILDRKVRKLLKRLETRPPSTETPLASDGPANTPKGTETKGTETFDTMAKASTMEARLNAQIDRAMQRLVMLKEFRKQYGPPSTLKLIEGPTTETQDIKRGRKFDPWSVVDAKNNASTGDDQHHDNNNDNDNEIDVDPRDYDDERDYEEDLKQAKREAKQEAQKTPGKS